MQIKNTRYHYTPTRITKNKRLTIVGIGKNVQQLKFSYIANENVNWYNQLYKNRLYRLKLNICPVYGPKSFSWVCNLTEMNACVYQNTQTRMFTEALLGVIKNWKKCLLMGEWTY